MLTAGFTLLLFTAALWCNADAFSDQANDCCLSTSGNLVPRHIAASYVLQNDTSVCRLPATVFITKKNRKICSPPPEDANAPWVKKLIMHLDKLASHTASRQ